MSGQQLIEHGAKGIIWLMDLCLVLFCCGSLVIGVYGLIKRDKWGWFLILISLVSGLVSIIFSGLALIPWWS